MIKNIKLLIRIFFIIIILLINIKGSFANNLISYDVKNTDIRDILRAIGIQKNINIVCMPEVKGNLSIHLDKVTIEEALDATTESLGFKWKKSKSIYEVYKPFLDSKQKLSLNIVYKNNKLTIKAKDINIIDLLVKLSEKTKISFIPDKSVKGNITIYLNEIPLNDAIKNILDGTGYEYFLDNNVYKIYKTDKKKKNKPKLNIKIDNNKISIDVVSADIGSILKEISKKMNLDMIFYGNIKGKIDKLKLTDMKIDDCLNRIVEGTKFAILKEFGVYQVSSKTDPNSSIMVSKMAYFKIKNMKVNEIVKLLPSYIKNEKIKVYPDYNSFAYEGTGFYIKKLKSFIKKIDVKPPTVMIEAKIIDFSDDLSKNQNLSFILKGSDNSLTVSPGNISADLTFNTIKNLDDKLNATLQLLISEGKAEVKASPKISTINGKEAEINVALEEHFKVTTGNVETPLTNIQKISSGIQLRIKPTISDNSDNIRVELFIKVSSPGSLSTDGIPAVNTRDAKTELSIKNGETIIIAGLIQNRKSNTEEKVPILGSIPLLKHLFKKTIKSSSKSELIFYITPRIVK